MTTSTLRGQRFVLDLLDYMIGNEVWEKDLRNGNYPLNLAAFPIEQAAYEKIVKIMRSFSDFDGQTATRNSFQVTNDITGDDYRATFEVLEDEQRIRVRLEHLSSADG